MDNINYAALESLREENELDMDPEVLEWLLQAYGGQLQGGELDDKLAQARALRDRGLNQPEGRRAGRTYVSQNPLETIGATAMGIKGIRDEKSLLEERRKLNKEQGDRAARYGADMFKRRGQIPRREQRRLEETFGSPQSLLDRDPLDY